MEYLEVREQPNLAPSDPNDPGNLTLAVVAHDAKKNLLVDWVRQHRRALAPHRLICTATTGGRVREACPELLIETVKSGPFGGDQQIGALIALGRVDALIFFKDLQSAHAHHADVEALTRLALDSEIPCAFNRRTADLVMLSGFCGSVPMNSSSAASRKSGLIPSRPADKIEILPRESPANLQDAELQRADQGKISV